MQRFIPRTLAACVLAAVAVSPAFAASDLTGRSIDVNWDFGATPVSIAARTVTVGAGPEIQCAGGGVGPDLCAFFVDGATIDLGANSLSLSIDSGTASWTSAGFNGYEFSNLSSGGPWTGYSLSTTFAGLDASRVTFTPDAVWVNLQGIAPIAGESFTITLSSAVPEPSELALLLAGLGAVACVARRRR